MNVLLVGAIAPPLVNKVSSGCLPFGAMAPVCFLKTARYSVQGCFYCSTRGYR